MKQQHLLFMAMAILVLYSLIFSHDELIKNPASNDIIKIATQNNKQIAPTKVNEFKTQLIQTEFYERTSSEFKSKCFIQDDEDNLIFSTITFSISRIDFGMGPLQI